MVKSGKCIPYHAWMVWVRNMWFCFGVSVGYVRGNDRKMDGVRLTNSKTSAPFLPSPQNTRFRRRVFCCHLLFQDFLEGFNGPMLFKRSWTLKVIVNKNHKSIPKLVSGFNQPIRKHIEGSTTHKPNVRGAQKIVFEYITSTKRLVLKKGNIYCMSTRFRNFKHLGNLKKKTTNKKNTCNHQKTTEGRDVVIFWWYLCDLRFQVNQVDKSWFLDNYLLIKHVLKQIQFDVNQGITNTLDACYQSRVLIV